MQGHKLRPINLQPPSFNLILGCKQKPCLRLRACTFLLGSALLPCPRAGRVGEVARIPVGLECKWQRMHQATQSNMNMYVHDFLELDNEPKCVLAQSHLNSNPKVTNH